jgi:hypothetical protein
MPPELLARPFPSIHIVVLEVRSMEDWSGKHAIIPQGVLLVLIFLPLLNIGIWLRSGNVFSDSGWPAPQIEAARQPFQIFQEGE